MRVLSVDTESLSHNTLHIEEEAEETRLRRCDNDWLPSAREDAATPGDIQRKKNKHYENASVCDMRHSLLAPKLNIFQVVSGSYARLNTRSVIDALEYSLDTML